MHYNAFRPRQPMVAFTYSHFYAFSYGSAPERKKLASCLEIRTCKFYTVPVKVIGYSVPEKAAPATRTTLKTTDPTPATSRQ